eukprot:TRINITY_DN3322_c0_g2_i1.p1 TRINITY_DN3322_c0_g2~~TRINITY_DN3322_c0_g2_i1.p1  ORF type:complete len:333 (+),score=76.28 TRINITY_DN3322_c0_g2_i1:127-1125(+)
MMNPLVALIFGLLSVRFVTCLNFPKLLPPGSTIAFISPASPPYYLYNSTEYVPHVISSMKQFGWNVVFMPHCFEEYYYLAGNDSDRASDVMMAFKDPNIDGIFANRGGWGDQRILPLLDFDIIAQNPKVLMGYSDLTALINAVHLLSGMVTFHGPMGIGTWNDLNGVYAQEVLQEAKVEVYNVPDGNYTTITGGKANGTLIGGNLSVFVSLVGTPYFPNPFPKNTILFLEDVEEAPYAIDRMLTQLDQAGVLPSINGFVFGRCPTCVSGLPPNLSFTLDQVLVQKIAPLNIPSFYGALFGHIEEQITLPIGVAVEIDADQGLITFLEAAVSN